MCGRAVLFYKTEGTLGGGGGVCVCVCVCVCVYQFRHQDNSLDKLPPLDKHPPQILVREEKATTPPQRAVQVVFPQVRPEVTNN